MKAKKVPYKKTKIKWGDVIILVMTVIASFSLILFANKDGRKSALHTWTLDLAGRLVSPVNRFHELLDIRDENSRLKFQNIKLQLENSILNETDQENKRLLALLEISESLTYENIAARVVGFDGMDGVKSVILDIGNNHDHDIVENMPFVAENGLAGKIGRVSGSKAVGQVLTDKNFRVAARLQNSRYTGLFEGTGKETGIMWGVPLKAKITIGEEILTSGMNSLFPAGLKIGRVVDFKDDPNSLFQLLIIEPDVEYTRLEEVLIIKSKAAEK
ncbi:rod shape-determining protein MreC [candidate division KSB1 bacterium]|nr:rod shape-determining protein MreC [candidate division KSB1 bacterium]